MSRHLLYGLGVTNAAVAAALLARGEDVVVADDRPDIANRTRAEALGVGTVHPADAAAVEALVAAADVVVPAPGLPDAHAVFAAARRTGTPVLSEFDLARQWDSRPLLSITGTNGKTTVTTLVTDMLNRSGRRAAAVGNTELPLVGALDDRDVEVFVVEASSFRLAHTQRFTPVAAAWLNFAEDHLDVHDTLADYEAAKARSWADLDASGTAVANADDPVVVRHVGEGGGTFVTFGLEPSSALPGIGHATVVDGVLTTADGDPVVEVGELVRSMPHDVANALAATTVALAGGATLDGVRDALRHFTGLSHRVELVADADGVRWYDDSKATAPHAVIAAVGGFDSVVLVAGGRNKGLDLGALGALRRRLRAVVGIGEAGRDVVAALDGVPNALAASMEEAVEAAAGFARHGDAVILSPGCASFDWYANYGERGDHFARIVRERLATP